MHGDGRADRQGAVLDAAPYRGQHNNGTLHVNF